MEYTKELLERMVSSGNWIERAEAARQGYGLETLVNDKNLLVRSMAKKTMEIIKRECVTELVKGRKTDEPIEVLFTFGTLETMPFQGGYVSIKAPTVEMAIAEFRKNWPDKTPGIYNYSAHYFKEESVAYLKENGNLGVGCHKSIDITNHIFEGKSVDAVLGDARSRAGGIALGGKMREIEIDR